MPRLARIRDVQQPQTHADQRRAAQTRADIVVAIPTFRRPDMLAEALASVAALDTQQAVRVLVADNDAERHEGFALCEALKSRYRWPLEAFIVPERGITQVRNALCARALSDTAIRYVAMMDDDEWCSPDWIDNFLQAQAETGADIVGGTVLFEDDVPAWAEGGDGVTAIRHATGPIDMLVGAGNLFVTRAVLEASGPEWFDPAFGLTGGEDQDFFRRMKARDFRFAWSDEAVATGHVPPERRSFRWMVKRAYSVGNSEVRIALKHDGLRAALRQIPRIGGAFLYGAPMLMLMAFAPRRRAAMVRLLARAAGKCTALFGIEYREYAGTGE